MMSRSLYHGAGFVDLCLQNSIQCKKKLFINKCKLFVQATLNWIVLFSVKNTILVPTPKQVLNQPPFPIDYPSPKGRLPFITYPLLLPSSC